MELLVQLEGTKTTGGQYALCEDSFIGKQPPNILSMNKIATPKAAVHSHRAGEGQPPAGWQPSRWEKPIFWGEGSVPEKNERCRPTKSMLPSSDHVSKPLDHVAFGSRKSQMLTKTKGM